MQIANFEQTGLVEVVDWIKRNNLDELEKKTLKEALKTVNISFLVENINRIQSTLLCELKDSYVQQSQRYVDMKEEAYLLPDLEKNDKQQARELIDRTFTLYDEMSELREEASAGRPQIDDYKYGIPIEDARYILPLAARTNISLALSGDKLYNLFKLLYNERYRAVFKEFRIEIKKQLPEELIDLLTDICRDEEGLQRELADDLYRKKFDRITSENKMVLLESFDDLDLKVGLGAATSTSASTPSEKLESWGDKAVVKARELTKKVLGYGHRSIAEQARTTFGMMCSLVTYHQQIRHRISKNYREEFAGLLKKKRDILVPPTVEDSPFAGDFRQLAREIREFRSKLLDKYSPDKVLPFLLNCEQIKLIISTNARSDSHILAERICNNAQWEIRNLYTSKLKQLRKLSPVLYEKALPPCVYEECTEAALSCGRQEEMRRKWRDQDRNGKYRR